MKQVGQRYSTGDVKLVEVADPIPRPGGVVVRTSYSLVSSGTERQKVVESQKSLVGMARARPDQVRQVMDSVRLTGVESTIRKVRNRLDTYTPLGYSLAGTVVAVGDGVTDLEVGRHVACAGNQYATHAELNWVPRNLCVTLPDSVSLLEGSFTTVGAIALQALRQAAPQIGETACVIGLGLVGQILVQLLRAAGVSVVGFDTNPERSFLAKSAGAVAAGSPDGAEGDLVRSVLSEISDGAGADHVFLAASTSANGPVRMAAELARDRATVIDIANCRLDLPWKDYYEKELDVRFSRSYGPGRYDPSYEEEGHDYPIGYVRWTEERNMKAFVELLAQKRLDMTPLIGRVLPFSEAEKAYEMLSSGEFEGVGIVFEYPTDGDYVPASRITVADRSPREKSDDDDLLRLGFIGAGNYATTMLLPHLAERDDVDLVRVATATSLSGASAAERFGFGSMTTDPADVIDDPSVDAVVIATRHDTHAGFVTRALQAGKVVFCEKPLALDTGELSSVADALRGSGTLMVGYNRRHAPALKDLRRAWGPCQSGTLVNYDVNAGPLDASSWYGDSARQGSRFVGEGGHFVDTVSWWIGEDPIDVLAVPTGAGGLECILRYPNDSVARISYATGGARGYPKETFRAAHGGATAVMENFRRSIIWRGSRSKTVHRSVISTDKGQKDEVAVFVAAARGESQVPTSHQSLLITSLATLLAEESARTREVLPLELAGLP